MIALPSDAWAARSKEYRISDTRETRQAFHRGALYAVEVAAQAVAKSDPEILTTLIQALKRFARECC